MIESRIESSDTKKRSPRAHKVSLRNQTSGLFRGQLVDISIYGCCVATDEAFAPCADVDLELAITEAWPCVVVWCDDGLVGLTFGKPMYPSVVERYGGLV